MYVVVCQAIANDIQPRHLEEFDNDLGRLRGRIQELVSLTDDYQNGHITAYNAVKPLSLIAELLQSWAAHVRHCVCV